MSTSINSIPSYAVDASNVPRVEGMGGSTSDSWMIFCGTMLGLAGIMKIIDAIWAFHYHGALPENLKDGLLGSDLKHYGWLWVGVGALLILSGVLVVSRSQFGRWFGVFAAGVGLITAMFWMPYYPIWALTYVVVAAFVLYGLVVHGSRNAT
jgi:hypothetical protein